MLERVMDKLDEVNTAIRLGILTYEGERVHSVFMLDGVVLINDSSFAELSFQDFLEAQFSCYYWEYDIL